MHSVMSEAARVTVTLDPRIAAWAREAAARHHRSLDAFVAAAVRTAVVCESLTDLPVDEDAERAAAHDELDLLDSAAADARRRSRGDA